MKAIPLKIKTVLLLLMLGFAFGSCSSDDDSASEDCINYMEDWTIIGKAQGNYVKASSSTNFDYIHGVDDATGGVWFFDAPDCYLGNRSKYYGATLTYSQFQKSAMSKQFEREDILIKSGDQQIFYQISTFPAEEWTDYSVKIDENSGWRYGTFKNNNSTAATKAQIEDVLSNVTKFWIRGEFEVGPDESGLAKVQIITE